MTQPAQLGHKKPQPQPQPQPELDRKPKTDSLKIVSTALAAALAGWMVFGADGFLSNGGGGGGAAIAPAGGDAAYTDQIQKHENATTQIYVSSKDEDKAYSDAAFAKLKTQAPQEAKKLQDNDVGFFGVFLRDDMAEDGDVVGITVNGQYIADIPLTNAGTRIMIPLMPGNNVMRVTGKVDGGGGITLAMTTSNGIAMSPIMTPGQFYDITVSRLK